jgi:hypothetical protein
MSTINRENYEVYIIDLLEGSLNAPLQIELQEFLVQNPDLKLEFDSLNSFDSEMIEPDAIEKFDFAFLKKTSEDALLETKMIAAIEGDLSELELLDLTKKIKADPKLSNDFRLFNLSKLKPENIVFENRGLLKKHVVKLIPLYFRLSAIAAILVAFALAGILYFGSNQSIEKLSEQTSSNKSEKPIQMTKTPSLINGKDELKEKSADKLVQTEAFIKLANLIAANEFIELTPKEIQIAVNKKQFNMELQNEQLAYLPPVADPFSNIGSDQNYLKPSEWAVNRVKKLLFGNEAIKIDSIGEVNVGLVALNLLEKTTGIAYHDTRDDESGTKGFAIVSRFFAYERITHH